MSEEMLFGLWKDAAQHTLLAPFLGAVVRPWDILAILEKVITDVGKRLPGGEYERLQSNVWVARTARISSAVHLSGPCILGHDTELRPGAFVRGNVIVGNGATVGNSTELKNCILFDGVQVPHFNYVGDSILGYRAHLGAGAVTSNVKSDRSEVFCWLGGRRTPTGRRKLGALIGDLSEIGCHTVLNPGAVIGRQSVVYPCLSVRGYVGENCICKGECTVARKE